MFNNPYAYNPYAVPYQPQNQPQSQNQPIPMTNSQSASNSGIIWVNGIEEANNYLVAPNSAVPLWDRNGKAIYLKSADATGLCNIKIMDISERKTTQAVMEDNKEFALKEDINALQGEIDKINGILDSLTAKKNKKEVKNDE